MYTIVNSYTTNNQPTSNISNHQNLVIKAYNGIDNTAHMHQHVQFSWRTPSGTNNYLVLNENEVKALKQELAKLK